MHTLHGMTREDDPEMRDPVSELDPRFSDPNTVGTEWDAAREQLEHAQLSWISTVRADGRPHVTPLVSVWHDGAAYFTTGPHEQKAVNLSQNPHVVLTTGSNEWNHGLDVTIEGEAQRVTDAGMLQRLADLWAQKWDGRWRFEAREEGFFHKGGGLAYVYEVVPTKVLAFGKGDFTHTRHVFKPRT
jgi:nitroimidazol reductase NimA-like FMN-containing flavoprotein (pyridoxamine 5'-phosphate oxidase superfamily)